LKKKSKKEVGFEILINSYFFNERKNNIKNLNVWKIRKKKNVWYWVFKNKVNYFRYLWLNYWEVIKLIHQVLKEYHIHN
jgi:hypothetical protein